MKKLKWQRPLRSVRNPDVDAIAYNSDGQRVVWIGTEVYPVDRYGCSMARIGYPNSYVYEIGDPVVENVPEVNEVPSILDGPFNYGVVYQRYRDSSAKLWDFSENEDSRYFANSLEEAENCCYNLLNYMHSASVIQFI